MQSLVEALASFDGVEVNVPDLLERHVTQYPNLSLNLFCTGNGREAARTYLRRGEFEPLYAESDVRSDDVRSDVLFNFSHLLWHAGILAGEPNGHGTAIREYDPDEEPWRPGPSLRDR